VDKTINELLPSFVLLEGVGSYMKVYSGESLKRRRFNEQETFQWTRGPL